MLPGATLLYAFLLSGHWSVTLAIRHIKQFVHTAQTSYYVNIYATMRVYVI